MVICPPIEISLGPKAQSKSATVRVSDSSAAQASWTFNVMRVAGAPAKPLAACLRGSGMSG
jgi:hypothetical protein